MSGKKSKNKSDADQSFEVLIQATLNEARQKEHQKSHELQGFRIELALFSAVYCDIPAPMLLSRVRACYQTRSLARKFSSADETAFIAVGSNLGNRAENVHKALNQLRNHAKITQTSFLYESTPMYKTDQPSFLNAVVQTRTTLPPHELLRILKAIESELGRDQNMVRNGPRPIDLDILTYGTYSINDDALTIPHPRIAEREFVLQPLYDINSSLRIGECSVEQMLHRLHSDAEPDLIRVTPTKSGRLIPFGQRTLLMGVINATPDSFSDGGVYNTTEKALEQVSRFHSAGFDIVDIGGQSTRPGAVSISAQEEASRVTPILEGIAKAHPEILVSCDTYHSSVAKEAFDAGADIVNDVTAGKDTDMFQTVRDAHAAVVLMHMRGEPATMQDMAEYDNLIPDVAKELNQKLARAMDAGIPRWSILTDPGIGFAKTSCQSLELMRSMGEFKRRTGGFCTVLAASRKSCLCTPEDDTYTRDWKTAGALGAAVAKGGVDMVRVHSADIADAVRAADRVRG